MSREILSTSAKDVFSSGDLMADHGFGKTQTGSPISDEETEETARQISEKKYIVRAWTVRHDSGKSAANIVFQFDHISLYKDANGQPMTHDKMVAEIETINVNGHRPRNTDIYIVLKDFAKGKLK